MLKAGTKPGLKEVLNGARILSRDDRERDVDKRDGWDLQDGLLLGPCVRTAKIK